MKDIIDKTFVICFGIPLLIIIYIFLLLFNFIEATINTTAEFIQTFKDCIIENGDGDENDHKE